MKFLPAVIKQSNGFTTKSITVKPNKEDGVFSYNDIKLYVEKHMPKNKKVIVRATNILRDTTLKGFNDDFMTEDEYDDYARGRVKNYEKFKYFYSFTVTVVEANEIKQPQKANKKQFGF